MLVARIARLLVAAEGLCHVAVAKTIDPDHTRFQRADHAVGLLQVACPHRCSQPVDRVVRQRDGLVHGVERGHGCHRAEHLFARDAHLAGGPDEQGGLDKRAARDGRHRLAAHGQLRPFVLPARNACQHVALVRVARQGPECGGRIQRVARAVRHPGARDETPHKLVVDAALHQQPRAGIADLAGVVEDATDGAVHRGIEVVQVVEEDLRALAAGLQRHAFHVRLPGITKQQLADGGGAGERELDHVRVQRQRLAGFRAQAVDDVEHPRRAASLDKQLRQPRARQRSLFGRLEHHAVARRQDRGDFPDRHQHRVVPGRDGADHAQRLVQDQVQRRGVGMCHRPLDLVDAFREVADRLEHFRQVDLEHVADRLAHVQGFQQGQLVAVGVDPVGEAQQDVHARARRQAAPAAVVPGLHATGDRGVDIGCLAPGHFGQDTAVGRIHAVEGFAAHGRHMPSVDEQPGGDRQAACRGSPLRAGFQRAGGHGNGRVLRTLAQACLARPCAAKAKTCALRATVLA